MNHSPFDLHGQLREGTPVVPLLSRRCLIGHLPGQIFSGEPGVVVRRSPDLYSTLAVKFGNGAVVRYMPHEVATVDHRICPFDLRKGIVLTTRIGSRAHGIARPDSDDDLRGVFVAPSDLQWSLMATPRRIEYLRNGNDELYYEIEGFVRRLLTGDPMALETLFSHDVVQADATGEYLLSRRQEFLTRPALLGFPVFLRSATKKLHTAHRRGKPQKPKALMHWLRLALSGLRAAETGELTLEVREYAPLLIDIREGKWSFERVFEEVFKTLRQFRDALDRSPLPDRPATACADECLIYARAQAAIAWLESNEDLVSGVERSSIASRETRLARAAELDAAWEARESEAAAINEFGDPPTPNGEQPQDADPRPSRSRGKRRRRRGKGAPRDNATANGTAHHNGTLEADNGERDDEHDSAETTAAHAEELAAPAPNRTYLVLSETSDQPARVVYVSSEGAHALNGDEVGEATVETACGWKEGPGKSGSKKERKKRGDWEDDEDWNEGVGELPTMDAVARDGIGSAPKADRKRAPRRA